MVGRSTTMQTTTTTTQTTTGPPGNEAGAVAATALVGTLAVAAGLGSVAAILLAPLSFGTSVTIGIGLGYASVAGLQATGDMIAYDIQYGPNATPQGAFEAGGNSFLVNLAENILGDILDSYGII